jgi:hypothetical protein
MWGGLTGPIGWSDHLWWQSNWLWGWSDCGTVSPARFHHGGLTGWVAIGTPAPGKQRLNFAFHRHEVKSILWPSSMAIRRGAPDSDCNCLFTIEKLLHYHLVRWCQPGIIFWSWIADDHILPFSRIGLFRPNQDSRVLQV